MPVIEQTKTVPQPSGLQRLLAEAWLPFGIIALLWVPAVLRFSNEWSINPQYYYGWSVPLLALYLVYDRFASRPPAAPPRRPGIAVALIILLALPQLPLRLLGEANSSARLISLAMGISAIGISGAILYLAGGRGWLRHFIVPVLFMAVSIPWPGQVEKPLVQGLMRVNAQIAAEVVTLGGVPAEARGNVIEVPGGILGVNEACSGIRSLQSTFMAAIFLAALYRLSAIGYAVLAGAGAAIAFVCNIIRTTFLTWEGGVNGIEATEKWHDSAGFAILGVVLVCLWIISQILERRAAASGGVKVRSEGEE